MQTRTFWKFLGAVGAAFSLTLGACGVEDTNIGEQEFAVAGEDCEPVGSNLPSEDGCNTCQCTSAGTWACTLRDCNDNSCVEGTQRVADDGCNTCTCTDSGDWACTERACAPVPECQAGATRMADDGCNTCTCTPDGLWACTLLGCPEPACDLGSERPSDDGCNSCTCTASGWACTDRACAPDPTTCTEGQERPSDDGCNICTCIGSGDWACTTRACAPTCDPGDQKMADDGCNTCSCTESGDWACTEIGCSVCLPGETMQADCNGCTCNQNGQWQCTLIECNVCPGPNTTNRPAEICATVTVWAKDPESGNCCQYGTPCSAPTDWKQYSTEAECEEATACPAPSTSFAPGGCAAVVVWAKDPATGGCCQYPDPCSAPEGWEQFYSATECAREQ